MGFKIKKAKCYEEVTKVVEENDGYCPCCLEKNKDTLCICKEFIEAEAPCICKCGRYEKLED